MKVRMSYDIEAEKIPAELKKNKREIAELLGELSQTFHNLEILKDAKTIKLCTIAVQKSYEDTATVLDKISSLLNYLSSFDEVLTSLEDTRIREKAEALIAERTEAIKEEFNVMLKEKNKEFNELIQEREEAIKILESKVDELSSSKKKPQRRKKNA